MKSFAENAPYGITAIQLDNGDESIYLHGEFVACADIEKRDDSILSLAEHLATVMGVPYRLLILTVPDDKEWAWNDVIASLGWGKSIDLTRMKLRSVLECCINHITETDNLLLSDLCLNKFEGDWIMDTDVGYLIRLDARSRMLLRLKKLGVSRSTRALIYYYIRQAKISMIHFSSVGEELDGSPTFDW